MMINGLIHWKTWTKNSEKTEQYFKITSTWCRFPGKNIIQTDSGIWCNTKPIGLWRRETFIHWKMENNKYYEKNKQKTEKKTQPPKKNKPTKTQKTQHGEIWQDIGTNKEIWEQHGRSSLPSSWRLYHCFEVSSAFVCVYCVLFLLVVLFIVFYCFLLFLFCFLFVFLVLFFVDCFFIE